MEGEKALKMVTGLLELILAVPVLGIAIIYGFLFLPAVVMFVLHLVTLVITINNKNDYYGSIVGLIAVFLSWIPFIGWLFHLLAGILILVTLP
ncbi:conserved hypothetical protein [[Clostridium] ultunense Esp]|uniref:hypothetical protein n=1 Tax=Thermicanus aegyptius TaxID=94009 RepID=UPI0002B6FC3A|nr:hypothetical protein [Thermicanus aegyptius]CCQ94148.1 conserved hypothetical protein [[Clostridium] ultunense Esp]